MNILHFNDFVSALLSSGFSMGGGKSDGIFAVIAWGWEEPAPYETPVRWHTGDQDTDPWEWRIRVLDERTDITYGKLFFNKSGFITKEWYPYFLAARRGNETFDEAYETGKVSHEAKRIYKVINEHGVLPLHAIKQLAFFSKEEKSRFDKALTELQMKFFITMCGRAQKLSRKGQEYGWSSTVFCTTEEFWGEELFHKAEEISAEEAINKITAQILSLNPEAEQKKIIKFIKG